MFCQLDILFSFPFDPCFNRIAGSKQLVASKNGFSSGFQPIISGQVHVGAAVDYRLKIDLVVLEMFLNCNHGRNVADFFMNVILAVFMIDINLVSIRLYIVYGQVNILFKRSIYPCFYFSLETFSFWQGFHFSARLANYLHGYVHRPHCQSPP